MKKLLLLSALFLTTLVSAQEKRSLLKEMKSHCIETIYNKPIDAEYDQLFNAMLVIGNQEYPNLVKESQSRGYLEFSLETETVKETLSMEILGTKKPYNISFQVKKQIRSVSYDGKLTDWTLLTGGFNDYILKLQLNIHKILFGEIQYPEELLERVELYNDAQKKDKSKILKGKDY